MICPRGKQKYFCNGELDDPNHVDPVQEIRFLKNSVHGPDGANVSSEATAGRGCFGLNVRLSQRLIEQRAEETLNKHWMSPVGEAKLALPRCTCCNFHCNPRVELRSVALAYQRFQSYLASASALILVVSLLRYLTAFDGGKTTHLSLTKRSHPSCCDCISDFRSASKSVTRFAAVANALATTLY